MQVAGIPFKQSRESLELVSQPNLIVDVQTKNDQKLATFYKSNKSNGAMIKESDGVKNEVFSFKDLASRESSHALIQKVETGPNAVESALLSPSAMRELSQLYNLQGAMPSARVTHYSTNQMAPYNQ